MPFFNRVILAGGLACVLNVSAQETGISETIDAAIARSKEAGWLEGINTNVSGADLTKEQEIAKEIAEEARRQLISGTTNHLSGWVEGADQFAKAIEQPNQQRELEDIPTDYPGMKIYISFGMPESIVKEALRVSSQKRIPIQVRGLLKGTKNILNTFQYVAKLTNEMELDPAPLFQLDPNNFRKYGITGVPAMTYEKAGKIYKVAGVMNPDWFIEQLETSSETDLGVFGDVHDIDEMDFVEDMQKRMLAIDWEQKKRAAYENFWSKQTFTKLPRAQESATWYIDPTVKIQKDVFNRKGELIGMAGEIINPLEKAHTQIHLVVFNPSNESELAWVDSLLSHQGIYSKLMLLATEIDTNNGWKQLESLRARFKRNVYLSQPEIIRKFALKGTPTEIEATGKYFTVTQHALPETLANKEG
ncbi:TrbC family F-type conjugative pilus assembly protein [Motilimonas eburnea]|uniref:TrbC family F-type conjugative pilus assembly protein n=1 Tax=Motilimonas eburnea TaxID=1737488 RepID=UPI001E31AD19|nr:TrbC family F-type conjugative pilus assembly protein [Motilimonas eburnea]MCE2571711.1 hypothetical protein [Motilimonas eburnea]